METFLLVLVIAMAAVVLVLCAIDLIPVWRSNQRDSIGRRRYRRRIM